MLWALSVSVLTALTGVSQVFHFVCSWFESDTSVKRLLFHEFCGHHGGEESVILV